MFWKLFGRAFKNPTAHLVYTSGHHYTDKNTGRPKGQLVYIYINRDSLYVGYFPIFAPVVGYKKFMRCIKWTGILIDAAVIYGELRYIWRSQAIIMFDIEIIYTYIHLAQNNVWNRNPDPYLGFFSSFRFGMHGTLLCQRQVPEWKSMSCRACALGRNAGNGC